MNLFEINQSILNSVDLETGEILDEEALAQLQMTKEEKVRNIACWILNLISDEDALKKQEVLFKERREKAQRKRESLEKWLDTCLDGEKISTPEFVINYRKSTKLIVEDESKVPEEFWKVQAPKLDLAGLKDAVKGGLEVEGAYLKDFRNMSVK